MGTVFVVVVLIILFMFRRRLRAYVRRWRMVLLVEPDVRRYVRDLTRPAVVSQVMDSAGLSRAAGRGPTSPPLRCVTSTPLGVRAEYRPFIGQAKADWERLGPLLVTALGVDAVRVSERPGRMVLDVITRDPLEVSFDATFVPCAVEHDWSLLVGLDEMGDDLWWPLRNRAGSVVGGVPGSGKSAGLGWLLAQLLWEPVQFAVFDGKGGSEWEWMLPRAFLFDRCDDLKVVRDEMRSLVDLLRARARTMMSLTGSSNFWSTGPTEGVPYVVVVIDECQRIFDSSGLSKDQKALVAEITSCVADLVRQGRSLGFLVVSATQRPTADSIPTQVRDNSDIRGCFAVRSREAEIATLGSDIGDSVVRPTALSLPRHRGVMVTQDSVGDWTRCRLPFIDEERLMELAEESAELRIDPRVLTATDDVEPEAVSS